MIKSLKKNKKFTLKSKMVNSLLINGKKNTSEKILLKFAKRLQKSTNKNFKSLLQLALINSTPTFKINKQVMKRGKRKAIKTTPLFIMNESLRVSTALKSLKQIVLKNKNSMFFYEAFVKEILSTSTLKSDVVDHKNDLQKQVLINKRYLSKYRW